MRTHIYVHTYALVCISEPKKCQQFKDEQVITVHCIYEDPQPKMRRSKKLEKLSSCVFGCRYLQYFFGFYLHILLTRQQSHYLAYFIGMLQLLELAEVFREMDG